MIKFFRKIRQQLLTENKFSKYLLYAIGEIFLVVIGILIALQINTWNNNRIQLHLEGQFLKEIAANLNDDLNQIESVLIFNKTKDSAINETFQLMSLPDIPKAKLKIRPLMPFLTEYEVFIANQIAFDNLTSSSSINLISSNSLRQKLSRYYKNTANLDNFTQEQIKQQTRKFVDESVTMLIDDELVKTLTGFDIKIDQNSNFFTNPQNFKNLFNMKKNMISQNEFLDFSKKQINSILIEIEKNIN